MTSDMIKSALTLAFILAGLWAAPYLTVLGGTTP